MRPPFFIVAAVVALSLGALGLFLLPTISFGNFTSSPLDPVESSQEVGHVCGESERAGAPGPEFLRHEGVSAFTNANTEGAVLNNRIRSIAIDSRGLWIGYFATETNAANGLGQYNFVDWAHCDPASSTAGNINAVIIDHSGDVWIATENNGVVVFDGMGWRRFTRQDGLPSNSTYGLTVDEDNSIWIATWEGVAKFDGEFWSVPYSLRNNTLFDNHAHAIAFESNGDIWIGHISEGISRFVNAQGEWVRHTAETGTLGGNQIRSIIEREGDELSPRSIWIATADGGITRYQQGEWTIFSRADGIPSNGVNGLAIDKHNRVWAATDGGTAYFDGAAWIKYSSIPSLSIAFGLDCEDCPIDSDHVWVSTYDTGLTHSRVPYPDTALDVIEVCFELAEREERECQPISGTAPTETLTVESTLLLSPGQHFRFELTVRPRAPYELREDRGDFLSNVNDNDEDRFGSHFNVPVLGTINAGEPYTFISTPLIAPEIQEDESEQTFTTSWQVWMHTRYADPTIHLSFNVMEPE